MKAKFKFQFPFGKTTKAPRHKEIILNELRAFVYSWYSHWSILFFFLFQINCFGQFEQYNYKREITDVSEQWHKVILPNDVFGKVNRNFSDIRIYGISESDTIEAPYILKTTPDKTIETEIQFNLINTSRNQDGYFFTLEVPSKKTINHIDLNFREKNFNQKIRLEGSHNQEEWFTIMDDYRILSIKNTWTDYTFSTIQFSNSNYRYYRFFLKEKENIHLNSASIGETELIEGIYNNYPTESFRIQEDKKKQQTIVGIDLGVTVPVSQLKIEVENDFDFYRPITIKYLRDSISTEKGWKYQYRTLTTNTLTSFENNVFTFPSTTLQKLQVIIHNHDNQPLQIKTVATKGLTHELVARFNPSYNYFLTYGNSKSRKPRYDIDHFTSKIPENLTAVNIGREQSIGKILAKKTTTLFENKLYLWVIMGIIIALLGWFTLTMIDNKKD